MFSIKDNMNNYIDWDADKQIVTYIVDGKIKHDFSFDDNHQFLDFIHTFVEE